MKTNYSTFTTLIIVCLIIFSCSKIRQTNLKLWYDKPAEKWADAFPLGNGKLAAMNFGGINKDRFQINEESLWAGCQTNPVAENYYQNLKKIREMVFTGNYAAAHDFGIEKLTARPTSFRSYEPFADLLIEFAGQDSVSEYKRELDMPTGISRVSYKAGGTQIVRESFISAVDDLLCIRISSSGKEKVNCTIGLQRHKDAEVSALQEGRLNIDGQIVDIEAPVAYDDNPGGSGPGGKHMRFAGRLICRTDKGNLQNDQNRISVENAGEVILLFTAATDYNLSQLSFDPSIDPGTRAEDILDKVRNKSWKQMKAEHMKEHSAMFNRVSLDLGISPNDTLPTDKRLEAFRNGSDDNGLVVQLFQFGRYLLMGSSRRPAILPANLQGKWNEKTWAPWEADYHLNVNLQMNYWPADVTNLPETIDPLTGWFEKIAEMSRPFAKEMYNADGWFSCLATNPFGRVTPSASTPESQFINGVLDPLAGAWMAMNLWDHYEFSQDKIFLKEKLYPLLKGACGFILDVLVPDSGGTLHFVPSTSPENAYIDEATGRNLRITATSTYHLSVIKAVFQATLEAARILNVQDKICDRINEASQALPSFSVDENGRLMEWRNNFKENEPGHRHLSHLLGVYPFSLIDSRTPELFEAARKSLVWRQKNGQGGGGWSAVHAMLMRARFYEGEEAYQGLTRLIASGMNSNLLNASRIYQIDGNFGATAGIAEMLVQSHLKDEEGNYIIHLLPAIPGSWPSGSVKGLCARGGFMIDMDWKEGKLTSVFVSSENGGGCKIRYMDKTTGLILEPGEKRRVIDI